MSVRSTLLRTLGVLLIIAAVLVFLVGGFAAVCNSLDPGCSDQGFQGWGTPLLYAALTLAGVGALALAATFAFRRARRP